MTSIRPERSRRGGLACLLTGLCLVVLTACPAPAAALNSLKVMPFPGTPDASPSSQIIFSTLRPSDLVGVAVVGSASGRHSGHVVSLPDGAGTAFQANQPFAAGETVQVVAQLRSAAAAEAAGNGGSLYLRWSFAVAVPQPASSSQPASSDQAAGARSSGSAGPTQAFHSRPDLHPPLVGFTGDSDLTSGDIFLSPSHGSQPGALILSPRGRVLWFDPRRLPVYNLEVQQYLGKPVLTWWEGHWLGSGEDVIMDQSYRTVAVLHAEEGYSSDLHEFQITPQGTALVDIFSPVRTNLSGLGGQAAGTAMDCIIQELDIRTGRLLWEWHALGHIPLSASYAPVPKDTSAFDYFHINSIQELPNGNFLISSRSDWAVYEISRRTGNVVWSLGGKHPSFAMGPGTNFEWQHDAHLNPDGTLTLFDDAGSPFEERQSSAKVLAINTRARTVSLLDRFTHSPLIQSSLAGSMETLPNHDYVVGWGSQPAFSEFTPGGQLVFDGRFPFGTYSYRAYRFPWGGHPVTRPALVVAAAPSGATLLYVSWNGATHAAFWQALAGPTPGALSPVGRRVPWSNFETTLRRASRHPYWAVQALDMNGRVLATSKPQVMPAGG